MNRVIPLILAGGLLLTGCQLSLSAGDTINQTGDPSTGRQSPADTKVTADRTPGASTRNPGSAAPETTSASYPSTGTLSDPEEYAPGNPMTHSPFPIMPDHSGLKDKTGENFEEYRSVFLEHLRQNYPEHEFRLVSIMNYQQDGRTFKEASAYSEESLDIAMKLYYDGTTVTDSFERDVIGRQNTMNRWRRAFRYYLDQISVQVAPVHEVTLDVSYDYYEENIPRIILDAPLEPESREYTRCLEMYFEKGNTEPVKVADTAARIYQAMALQPYRFQEYFIYLEETDGTRAAFQIPLRIIDRPQFLPEMIKALESDSPDNLIRRIERP